MKEKNWIITILISSLSILGIFLVLTIINDWKWRSFYIPLIVTISSLLIGGFIYLIYKFRKKVPPQEEINIKEAVEFTKYEITHDEDNPDNLKVEDTVLQRIGAEGKEPTPVLVIYGKGTEMNQDRVIIRNMNNYKKEKSSLIDPSPEKIIKTILTTAEYPSSQITEEIKQSLEFGIPTTYLKRTLPSSTSQRKEIEKQEAEKNSAM